LPQEALTTTVLALVEICDVHEIVGIDGAIRVRLLDGIGNDSLIHPHGGVVAAVPASKVIRIEPPGLPALTGQVLDDLVSLCLVQIESRIGQYIGEVRLRVRNAHLSLLHGPAHLRLIDGLIVRNRADTDAAATWIYSHLNHHSRRARPSSCCAERLQSS
jgi:hypothetical protein